MTADATIDRRRLRRKVTFWRAIALLIAVIAVVAAALWGTEFSGKTKSPHIAKVRVEGKITEDEELLGRLKDVAEADSVKAVLLAIDSPGGTTAGGEAIYEAVRKIAEKKPVVAQVGTLAASAGYMIASATDHIIARQSSIVGSIGVLLQFPDVSGLMDKLGIKMESIKSSPLKAEPSPFNPTTEEERAMIRAMILDSYDWFVGLVEERRPLSRAEVLKLADGSVFTGRQALENKLVDGLGGEREAVDWLGEKGVDTGLDVIEWKPDENSGALSFLASARNLVGGWFGLPVDGMGIIRELGADRIFLDGMLSVWQPDENAISN